MPSDDGYWDLSLATIDPSYILFQEYWSLKHIQPNILLLKKNCMRCLFVASRHDIFVKSGLGERKGLYIALLGVAGVIIPALIGAVTQLVLMSMRSQSTTERRQSSYHSEYDSRSQPPGTLVSEANKHTSFSNIKAEDKSVTPQLSSVDNRDDHWGYTSSYSSNGSSSTPNTPSSAISKAPEKNKEQSAWC